LDYKRTFGELLESGEDAKAALRHTSRFRIAGQRARVLFALDAPPRFAFAQDAPEAALGPIHLADSVRGFNRTYDLWRTGALDTEAAVTLLVPSLSDPRLAPVGKATMTATISGVPSRLFDGAWTNEKRDAVRDIALAAAERVSPGLSSRVIAAQTLLPPDIEAELGATDGDLDGGEMTPDQVFPAPLDGGSATAWESGRTPIRGLYVAGSCAAPAPFLLAAAGERAAYAILTDLGKGRLV
jgi:phytoene dehydrogenase-like protein